MNSPGCAGERHQRAREGGVLDTSGQVAAVCRLMRARLIVAGGVAATAVACSSSSPPPPTAPDARHPSIATITGYLCSSRATSCSVSGDLDGRVTATTANSSTSGVVRSGFFMLQVEPARTTYTVTGVSVDGRSCAADAPVTVEGGKYTPAVSVYCDPPLARSG